MPTIRSASSYSPLEKLKTGYSYCHLEIFNYPDDCYDSKAEDQNRTVFSNWNSHKNVCETVSTQNDSMTLYSEEKRLFGPVKRGRRYPDPKLVNEANYLLFEFGGIFLNIAETTGVIVSG